MKNDYIHKNLQTKTVNRDCKAGRAVRAGPRPAGKKMRGGLTFSTR